MDEEVPVFRTTVEPEDIAMLQAMGPVSRSYTRIERYRTYSDTSNDGAHILQAMNQSEDKIRQIADTGYEKSRHPSTTDVHIIDMYTIIYLCYYIYFYLLGFCERT